MFCSLVLMRTQTASCYLWSQFGQNKNPLFASYRIKQMFEM